MNARPQPLVVGAGPAGIRVAEALVAAGLRPLVVDEAPACGGQIYRQRLVQDGRSTKDLYGSEASKAERLHATFAALEGKIDYWPQALLWNLRDGMADIVVAGTTRRVSYDGLVLATGATDRVLPIPGWTLPGVFTLGGSQVALKAQGCAIGSRVVFAGSGPLLYLVAWQYMKAGVEVAAVLDAAPASAKLNLLKALLLDPGIVLRGTRFVAELRLRGVAIRTGIEGLRFEGEGRVSGVAWREGDRERRLDCDGAGIAGADAAERAGERAALALLEDRGLAFDKARAAGLEAELARIGRLRDALEAAFPFPAHWVADIDNATTLCRCEEVTAGTVRDAASRFDIGEINRLKAVSRIGMGRCQGRMCAAASAEVLAAATGKPIEAVGRLRAQAPVKPIPLALQLASEPSNMPEAAE